jgi:hypothetical protein
LDYESRLGEEEHRKRKVRSEETPWNKIIVMIGFIWGARPRERARFQSDTTSLCNELINFQYRSTPRSSTTDPCDRRVYIGPSMRKRFHQGFSQTTPISVTSFSIFQYQSTPRSSTIKALNICRCSYAGAE